MEKAGEELELIGRYLPGLAARQKGQLGALKGLYREWNSRINVISRKDIDFLYERHVLHSMSIAAVFDLSGEREVIDIGTGGGFPGIPLAICFPEVQFHLVDSTGKKITVARSVADSIGLENVSTEQGRVEELRKRKFDCVVSRAVAPLWQLWDWSNPLLSKPLSTTKGEPGKASNSSKRLASPHGLICLKGGELEREISESGCHPTIFDIHQFFHEPFFSRKFILYVPIDPA